jgi:hypothetical protein
LGGQCGNYIRKMRREIFENFLADDISSQNIELYKVQQA